MSDSYHNVTVPPDEEFCPHVARALKAERERDELRLLLDEAFPLTVGKLRGIRHWSPEAFADFAARVERAL